MMWGGSMAKGGSTWKRPRGAAGKGWHGDESSDVLVHGTLLLVLPGCERTPRLSAPIDAEQSSSNPPHAPARRRDQS